MKYFSNPETKVGLLTLLALTGLLFLYLWLNGIQILEKGYDVEAGFSRVEGLRPGAPVKFSGVDIGRVSRIYFEDPQVVVVMRIQPNFRVNLASKAIISTSGIIGDKYIEISPLGPGQKPAGKRLIGQNVVSMDQFYATAYEVLDSLRQIAADIRGVTSQLDKVDIVELYQRVDRIAATVERIAQNSEPEINELLTNIVRTSAQLSETIVTANRFLQDVDANGKTAADLRETLANAKQVSANLEKFSALLANKGPELDMLIKDAHQTMQSITEAANKINQTLTTITSGEGDGTQVNQTLNQATQAVKKVGSFVAAFEKLSLKGSLGARYQYDNNLKDNDLNADFRIDLGLGDHHNLKVGWEDIGHDNLAQLQWGYRQNDINSRIGVYRSQFGVGFDLTKFKGNTLGVNLYDTRDPKLGVTSQWSLTKDWSFSVGATTDFNKKKTNTWDIELWRHF